MDFLNVYLDKGFGVMNKTEIETLFYHVFRKHGLLTGRCFDDSFKLQIPEAKARRLIYEAQVKYTNRDRDELDSYLRTAVGDCLTKAFIVKNNTEIRFVIEDKYLRIALNAKLRDNHYFADTSFNKDIVSLNEQAFNEMVKLLVPNFQKEQVLKKLTAVKLSDEVKRKAAEEIVYEFIKQLFIDGSVEGVKQIGQLMMALM